MLLFNKERQLIERVIIRERQMIACFFLGGISATVLPILAPKLKREIKLFSLLYGVASNAAATYGVYSRNRKENIYKSLDNAQAAALADQMRHTVAFSGAVQKIESQRKLAGYIAQLSQYEQPRWVQMFNLGGIIPPTTIDAVVEENKTVAIDKRQSSFDELTADLAPEIDYSWLNEKFVSASKVVFGPKGSGKSIYLAYEAIAFVQLHPDGELRIGDRHFSEDESQWLPGVPADILEKKYVASKREQILAMFRRAGSLLRHRVDSGIRLSHSECRRFKLICDEFESFILQLDDDEKKEVMGIIAQSQDEGRKYGVDITLGVHSLKKERIGIDSSVLFQMDVLCLGQALADPNTKFPADFDTKKLLSEQHTLQSILKLNQGFACVVRKGGEMPQVVVMPFIDLSQYQVEINQPSQNWLELIQQWVTSLGRIPTAAEVKDWWETNTGNTLTSSGLNLLMEHLKLDNKE